MQQSSVPEELEYIKIMFEVGKIQKMRQLEKMHPTLVAKLLGINYGRYIHKLHNPELFHVMEVLRMSKLLQTDIHLLSRIIFQETQEKYKNKTLAETKKEDKF